MSSEHSSALREISRNKLITLINNHKTIREPQRKYISDGADCSTTDTINNKHIATSPLKGQERP